ncbi:hypothetical protein BLA17378_08643 [Burkholderia aenigmatica]|uniref:Uncharacterized protein n=2 Tax=Burkholderia aenigmatica TaxID=2015348 RepID=A0ABY6Y7I7_9BURK|nr:hypothetical protein BLA17378_08643 [Burkholderia aenigmatica]
MVRRIKINIRKQSYDVFEYGEKYEKPYLYYKSRYLNEEYPRYAEQLGFDDELEGLQLFDPNGYGIPARELADLLESHRRCIRGFSLGRSNIIPTLDQSCGKYFRYLRFNFDSRRVIITPDYNALNWREQPYGAAAQEEDEELERAALAPLRRSVVW